MTIQSIYSGAGRVRKTVTERDFPALQVMIKLEQTTISFFGPHPQAADILIANNPHVFEKRLFSEKLGYGAELKSVAQNNEEHEAERTGR